ncbi:hypothetical protein WJX72_002562 [[Myrmecia] bisecta]|uniref:Phosphotransferase n=1 Tax=[Myrmecia] bisecta TaxID=41462 RepID=A0AAW1QQQ9_9CHLO
MQRTTATAGDAVLKEQRKQNDLLEEYRTKMEMPKSQMAALRDEIVRQMQAGLSGKKSSLLMIPSMVDILPTGKECGEFFAIDIGGTNFRTVYMALSEEHGKVAEVTMKQYEIPEELFTCHASKLYDFMASALVKFAKDLGRAGKNGRPTVGFCFSFPCTQTSLNSGTLVKWTKSFNNPGGIGEDPVRMLSAAFERAGMKVDVDVMLNDTVGTLAAARYFDPDAMVGVIAGTGTNAGYVEDICNIGTLPKSYKPGDKHHMIINTEWGALTSPLLPLTPVDMKLDAITPNVGEQHFEKLTGGMYMGEIARRILLQLAEEAELFGGSVPEGLRKEWSLSTPDMCKIDHDNSLMGSSALRVLQKCFNLSWPQAFRARHAAKSVAALVSTRSARLSATAISAALRQQKRDTGSARTVVAVDGGVFEHYTAYRQQLRNALEDLLGKAAADNIVLKHQPDGSSMGAVALAAAVASGHMEREV